MIELGRRDYAGMVEVQERLAADRLAGSIGDLLSAARNIRPPTPGPLPGNRRTRFHEAGWCRERGIEVSRTPRGGRSPTTARASWDAYPGSSTCGGWEQPAGADRVDVARFVASLPKARWPTASGAGKPGGPD